MLRFMHRLLLFFTASRQYAPNCLAASMPDDITPVSATSAVPANTVSAIGVSPSELKARVQRLAARGLKISCVIPAMNESGQVAEFIEELSQCLASHSDVYEIVLVDDGSTDDTLRVAHDALQKYAASAQLVSLSRNFGQASAIAAGLRAARGEVVVLMDADFQHPFDTIGDLLQAWAQGYDNVYAAKEGTKHESWLRRVARCLFHALQRYSSRVQLPYGASDFRLLDRKTVVALNSCTEQDKFMKGLYAFVGFRSTAVLYKVLPRRHGKSRYHPVRLTRFALSGFLSFSDLPLRVWSVLGFFVAFIAFVSALYIIIDTLILGVKVPGYTTLLVAIIFFGGIQMLSIGVLGEYIARIFREVKSRPAFIVQEKLDLGKPWEE